MRIGLREMRRSKVRFALLGGAVGLLVFLLLFFQSVAGTLVAALTGGIAQTSADVVVYDARARANPAASVLDREVVDAIAAVDGVAAAAPVAVTFAPVTPGGAGGQESGGEEQEAVLVGIEPGAPGTPRNVSPGTLPTGEEALSSGSGFDDAFAVGSSVTAGDTEIEVVGTAEDAAFNAAPTLYVPLDAYDAFVRARTGADGPVPASYVAVEAADGASAADLADRVTAQVDGVEALTREAAVSALPGVSTISRSFGILYLLLYIVVTIVTGVFFLILTVQKRDALVLLRAIGAERRDVVALVLLQVVLVVGVGVLVGVGLATGLLAAARDTFGASLDARTTVVSSAAILALALVAAGGAIRRVLKIEPVEAVQAGGLS